MTLRVAILAPISWRGPPRQYGPWEQFASLLSEGLVRRGVDVTLFATADSVTSARLVGTAPGGIVRADQKPAPGLPGCPSPASLRPLRPTGQRLLHLRRAAEQRVRRRPFLHQGR